MLSGVTALRRPWPDRRARGVLPPTRRAVASPSHRADIQALRAVAVAAVVVWHLDAEWLPSGFAGVDVFFVISGYLMTRSLLRSDLRSSDLLDFWARRCRRILPAATVVILATVALGWFLLPASGRVALSTHALWSSVYLENWRLAHDATDYLASLEPPSPFQHFWSLAVEEQFYLLWPVLLMAAAALAARLAQPRVLVAAIAITSVVASSALWSVLLGSHDPAGSYFVTTTRLWQLALGGLVAVLPALRSAHAARAVSAAGAVALAAGLVMLPSDLPYPGWIAWWPTLATALVVWAASAGELPGVGAIIRSPLVQRLGDISYSLYLWHWPVAVLLNPYHRPIELPSVHSLVVLGISLALAALTWRFVEQPFRQTTPDRPWSSMRGGLVLACCCLFLAVAVSGAGRLVAPYALQPQGYEGPPDQLLGATAIPAGATAADMPLDVPARFLPAPADIAAALPESYGEGCHADVATVVPRACDWGRGDRVIAVVGDSHAAQWLPAVQQIGESRGLRVVSLTKSNCPLTDSTPALASGGGAYHQCSAWNRAVMDRLLEDPPSLVLTSNADFDLWIDGSAVDGAADETAVAAGMASAWRELEDAGVDVVVVRDTPAPSFAIGACVANEATRLERCAIDRALALSGAGRGQQLALQREPRATAIDLNEHICDADRCPAVIGGAVVYRDRGHLTSTYVSTLTGALEQELDRVALLPARS
ncbi:acyltransferase family protein [Agrococcus sp. HG114]|uniref:acyltransferase family protein n=1 Tax=Agrococcus sp. HG114 TaxID=2969757 RepID=UPI00215A73C3|nr:acyltransferase family protein [Agrococcus sp. HG114]MCR8669841.1 acyltransferase [Agrococcus sp. HG114]